MLGLDNLLRAQVGRSATMTWSVEGAEIPRGGAAAAGGARAGAPARDFATADARRDELAALGWVVRDTPQGPQLERQQ